MKRIIGAIWLLLLAAIPAFATVSTETTRVAYTCNGVLTSYAYPFKVLADADLLVIKKATATSAETTLALNTDYTVTGAGTSGGNVVLTVGSKCGSGYTLTILRNMSATQTTDYVDGEAFSAESLEAAIDKATIVLQQQKEQIGRAPKLPETSTITDIAIPNPTANNYIGWNSGATGLENKSGPVITTATQYEVDALVSYGGGTAYTQATIQAALTAIGTTNKVTLLLRPGNWVILTMLDFPANVTVEMPSGAYFSGAGSVTGLKYATPEMFGATGNSTGTDNGVDSGSAITKALQAARVIEFKEPYYYISTEIKPTTSLNGITIKGSKSRLTWTGATDATKSVVRFQVASGVSIKNFVWDGVDIDAAFKVGYCFRHDGTAGATYSGGQFAIRNFSFQSATVANVLIGDETEPMVVDIDASHILFSYGEFYNAPYNVKINATNAYTIGFDHVNFGNNGTNPVIQHVRNLRNGSIWLDHCEFGILWKETVGHPHGATDDSYAVYSQAGGLEIRNCQSEDTRLLLYVDGAASYNRHVVVENFYTNDSSNIANRNGAYLINTSSAEVVLRNIQSRVDGATYRTRKIAVTNGSLIADNVNLGAQVDNGWWEISGVSTAVLDGRIRGEIESLVGNWDFSRWTTTTGVAPNVLDVPVDWTIHNGGEGSFSFERSTSHVVYGSYTGRLLNTTKPTTNSVAKSNGIQTQIERKNIGKVTVIVTGYSAAGDIPKIYINETTGQNGGTNAIDKGSGSYVLWAEADLSAQGSGDASVIVAFFSGSANGSDFYIDSVVIIPSYLSPGSQSFHTKAKSQRSPSVWYGNAAPTLNYPWAVGDTIINKVPTVGQPIGWKCTVAGSGASPGTWVAMANL